LSTTACTCSGAETSHTMPSARNPRLRNVSSVGVLWLVGAVAVFRTVRSEAGPGHQPTLLTFSGLVLALSWFARAVGQ
jgi:hypothetical protein